VVFNAVLAANPIGLVIAAVAGLAAGLVIAYRKSDAFRGVVDKTWSALKTAGTWAKNLGEKVGTWVVDKFEAAQTKLSPFLDALEDFKLPGWVETMGDILGKAGSGLKSGFGQLKRLNPFGDGPGLGGSPEGQPRGVRQMMAAVHSRFPGTRLISGYRPGAITATGNPSYHGKGRAVDLPPRPALFNWLKATFPSSRELIFSPAGRRQIHNGREHNYGGVTRRNHFDHVHWAMDRGGLARGVGYMPKLTSRPERVLSPEQTDSFERFLDSGALDYAGRRRGGGGGDVHVHITGGTFLGANAQQLAAALTPAIVDEITRRKRNGARLEFLG